MWLFFILDILFLWVGATFIVKAWHQIDAHKHLWRVTKKHPNKDLAGQIVKITYYDDKRPTVRAIDRVTPNSSYAGYADFIERRVEWNYLKKIRNVNEKGGGKKMSRMPRLFRFAIYAAVVILVWDVVLNANYMVSFVVHTFILHK